MELCTPKALPKALKSGVLCYGKHDITIKTPPFLEVDSKAAFMEIFPNVAWTEGDFSVEEATSGDDGGLTDMIRNSGLENDTVIKITAADYPLFYDENFYEKHNASASEAKTIEMDDGTLEISEGAMIRGFMSLYKSSQASEAVLGFYDPYESNEIYSLAIMYRDSDFYYVNTAVEGDVDSGYAGSKSNIRQYTDGLYCECFVGRGVLNGQACNIASVAVRDENLALQDVKIGFDFSSADGSFHVEKPIVFAFHGGFFGAVSVGFGDAAVNTIAELAEEYIDLIREYPASIGGES